MKIFLLSIIILLTSSVYAQKNEKQKEKKSVKEVIEEIPEMLIAQPDAGPDTNANKLINDNLSIVINPLWREKGVHSIIEFKLLKTDIEPLNATLPLPKQKLCHGLTINMNTMKKPAAEKKQAVLNQVKNHITAYYKEAGITITPQELTEKTNSMVVSSEPFSTDEGRQGEVYYIHDIEINQSHLIVLLLIPGTVANTTHFVHFSYTRYTYETTLPEDMMELKMFSYPDDQQAYIDFTKKILKTFRIK